MSERHYPTDENGQLDAGAGRDAAKPCAQRCKDRYGNDDWCCAVDGHAGEHRAGADSKGASDAAV